MLSCSSPVQLFSKLTAVALLFQLLIKLPFCIKYLAIFTDKVLCKHFNQIGQANTGKVDALLLTNGLGEKVSDFVKPEGTLQ